jgi:hypothetical protein
MQTSFVAVKVQSGNARARCKGSSLRAILADEGDLQICTLSGEFIDSFRPTGKVANVAFSPDQSVVLWVDCDSPLYPIYGKELAPDGCFTDKDPYCLGYAREQVWVLAMSPNKELLAVATQSRVEIFKVCPGTEAERLEILKLNAGSTNEIAFEEDGTLVVGTSQKLYFLRKNSA